MAAIAIGFFYELKFMILKLSGNNKSRWIITA
jgi:hypothetical protein